MTIDKKAVIENLRPNMQSLLMELKPDAKPAGKGKMIARCLYPEKHNNGDATPSMLLNINNGSFRCQACAAKGSLFDLHSNVLGVDFKTSLFTLAERAGVDVGKRIQQRVTGRYDYMDLKGRLAYYKERLEPSRDGKRSKEFIIKGPDGKPGQTGIPLLYRLNELAIAQEASLVLITEGEKHADFLASWGLLATSLPHGSGSSWHDSYFEHLSGKHVAVLADNDDVGRRYAEMICQALYSKAASVKIIDLPNLPGKGDVLDWAALPGNDAGLLLQIINGTDQWMPEPAEDTMSDSKWPSLSQDALPGIAGEFVRAACANSEADPAAVLATFLVRFGIECGANRYVEVGEARHYARTNGVIVGDSSKARKGTSAGPVKALFNGLNSHCRVSPGPLSSGEGLIYAVRDAQTEWRVDKKTHIGEWVVTDPGVDDKRLFVLDEEFANALSSANQKDNRLSAVLRTLYDDGNAEPLTKSNRTKATNAHVGVITHITLPELKLRLSATEMLNGFGNRFIWVCSRRQRLVPRPKRINDDVMHFFRKRIHDLIVKAQSARPVHMSDEADELWHEIYPKISASYEGAAGCMINRGEAHVTRLALIYALLAGHHQIELKDLQAALAFWQYGLESALYIFGQTPSDRKRQRVVSALEQAVDGSLTKDEIRRKCFSNHITADQLDQLLSEMESSRIINLKSVQTAGAPKRIISLVRVKREKLDNPTSIPAFQANHAFLAPSDKKVVRGAGTSASMVCYACKGTDFWKTSDGRRICRKCHPPVPGAEATNA